MSSRVMKIPDTNHPITVEKISGEVIARLGGWRIATSTHALVLHEAALPPVVYIPRADIDMALLRRTDHTTYCPYKGDASYFNILAGGEAGKNAAWSYENPYPAVSAIKDHIAFYSDRVEVEVWESGISK